MRIPMLRNSPFTRIAKFGYFCDRTAGTKVKNVRKNVRLSVVVGRTVAFNISLCAFSPQGATRGGNMHLPLRQQSNPTLEMFQAHLQCENL